VDADIFVIVTSLAETTGQTGSRPSAPYPERPMTTPTSPAGMFSSEVNTGSRGENMTNQKAKARF
jgi:hypothetical protein